MGQMVLRVGFGVVWNLILWFWWVVVATGIGPRRVGGFFIGAKMGGEGGGLAMSVAVSGNTSVRLRSVRR